MSHGDSRTTSSIVGEKTGGSRAPSRAGRRLAAPAEDDEVGLLLGRRLDDALRRVAADAHDRVDRRALGHEVEDALEQPAGVPGAGRALGQGHALGHLDDARAPSARRPRVQEGGAEPDQLLGGARVGDRDEDPRRAAARASRPASAVRRPAFQRR